MDISKLEKQVAQVESGQSKTLQQAQSQLIKVRSKIIKDYKMVEGDYKIIITIYQANDLEPHSTKFLLFPIEKSACDAFVQIQIQEQVKRTKVKKQTNNPIFDQQFHFRLSKLSVEELKNQVIKFTVYDKKSFLLSDSKIGYFQLDWTNVYFKRNHQIYRGWLTLSDLNDQSQDAVGYLLVNVAVLGPDDTVTVHDSAFIKDPLTTIEDTITSPKIKLIDYAINVQVYRAENLLPFDEVTQKVDAFVVAKFSGQKIKTSVKSSLNPQWNQLLKIGTSIPTKSKFVILEVWNRNFLGKNDLLGIMRVPFTELKEKEDAIVRWGHLYGPPMAGKDIKPYNHLTKMQIYGDTMGSTYRGRLLYKIYGAKDIYTKNIKAKIKFQFPFKPTPTVPLKSYTLRVQLLQGIYLPIRKETQVQISIGQYLLRSKSRFQQKNCQEWLNYQEDKIEDRKVMFPQDYQQIPDLLIYFSCGSNEADRMCYCRVPAIGLLSEKQLGEFRIYEFRADRSLGHLKKAQVGGYLTAKITLFTNLPPPGKAFGSDYTVKIPYTLKLFVYQGEDLPPGNQQGDCDPKVSFNFCGVEKVSKVEKETCNPTWNQVMDIEFESQDLWTTRIEKPLVCTVFDDEEKGEDSFIGKFWLRLSFKDLKLFRISNKKSLPFIYLKPQWNYIINDNIEVGNNIFGRVLLCCALFRREDITRIPISAIQRIQTDSQEKTIQLYLIGIRDMFQYKKHITKDKLAVKIKVGNSETCETIPADNRHGGCNINELYSFKLLLPKNKSLSTFVEIKFIDEGKNSFGYNSVNLYKLIPKLKEKTVRENEEKDSDQQTILNVQQLQQQLDLVRERRLKRSEKNAIINKYSKMDMTHLPLPSQLGHKEDKQLINNNQVTFDSLISDFETAYSLAPEYDYVRRLQEDNDKKQDEEKNSRVRLVQGIEAIDEEHNEDEDADQEQKLQTNSPAWRSKKGNNSQEPSLNRNKSQNSNGRQFPQRINKNTIVSITGRSQKYPIVPSERSQLEVPKSISSNFNQGAYASKQKQPSLARRQSVRDNIIQGQQPQHKRLKDGDKRKPAMEEQSLSGQQSRGKFHKNTNQLSRSPRIYNFREESADSTKRLYHEHTMVGKEENYSENSLKFQKQLIPSEEVALMQNQNSQIKKIKQDGYMKPQGQQKNRKEKNLNATHLRVHTLSQSMPIQTDRISVASHISKSHSYQSQQQAQIGTRNDLMSEQKLRYQVKQMNSRYDIISNFEIHSHDVFSTNQVLQKAVRYENVQAAIRMQQEHEREARLRQQQYKYAAAVKLSLFSWRRKPKKQTIQTYQDYDTDQNEDLNIIPEWYKGRQILITDFEELQSKNQKLHTIPIYRGVIRDKNSQVRVKQKIASIKMIALCENSQFALGKEAYYTSLMKPKQYVCRIYVLKGKSLISNYDIQPTTYLKFIYGNEQIQLKQTEVKNEANPEFYICHEIKLEMPGPATVRIEVMESHKVFGKLKSATLGYTDIDLETRYFTRKWHLYVDKKPIELRNLYSEYGNGTQGRLQTWIQLIPKKKWLSNPPHKIHPPPFYAFQLRVIVWQTRDCVYKNKKFQSNDVFVRAQIGTSDPQQTDTHWACRQTGSFNFRFKFAVNYPPKPEDMYSDIFTVQIWDRDIIGYNNLIGETRINLNRIHRIVEKGVKRKKPVQASMKIREEGLKISDRFWFSVLNHREKNQFGQLQTQGQVQLSFELVPTEKATQELKNGYGRSEPNVYPTLPQPSGRLSFDLLHPLDFLKQILGGRQYNKLCWRLCGLLVIVIIFLFFYSGLGGVITGAIVGSSVVKK